MMNFLFIQKVLVKTDDYLWAIVFAKTSGSLKLQIGTSSGTFPIQAGVNKVQLPLSPGSPTATLLRGTTPVLIFQPPGFTYTANPTAYNFNFYMAASSLYPMP